MSSQDETDTAFMSYALMLAHYAVKRGDAGYGCVIVSDTGAVLGDGWGSEKPDDCTCHSEVIAIRAAQSATGTTLVGSTLYSTFAPCMYCCGAINHAKVSRVVWGADREDLPGVYRRRQYTSYQLLGDTSNPPQCASGILRDACAEVTRSMPRHPRIDMVYPAAVRCVNVEDIRAARMWLGKHHPNARRRAWIDVERSVQDHYPGGLSAFLNRINS